MSMADAKLVFSIVENFETIQSARTINKSNIPVVLFRANQRDTLPDGVADLSKLMSPTGKRKTKYNYEP